MRRAVLAGATLAVLAATTACGPGFDPQSFIDKPRIVGIRAEPPEVQFTDAEQGTVTLTAYLALPEMPIDGAPGPREVTSIEWSMCVLNLGSQAGYKCAVPELPLDGDLATRTATFDGAILYAQFELIRPLMPQFIEFVKQTVSQTDTCQLKAIADWDACVAANPADPAPCVDPGFEAEKACLLAAGQDITFHLKVTWTDGTTDFVAEAYKKAFFRPITAERPANRNPTFSAWLSFPKPFSSVEITSVTAPSATPVVLACPGQKVKFDVVPDPDARETFLDTDGTSKKELLVFSFYSTAGEFERLKSSTATPTPDTPIDLTNVLSMPKEADFPAAFPVWIFGRDDRLGLEMLQFEVHPRPRDACTKPAGAPKTWQQPLPYVDATATPLIVPTAAPSAGGAP